MERKKASSAFDSLDRERSGFVSKYDWESLFRKLSPQHIESESVRDALVKKSSRPDKISLDVFVKYYLMYLYSITSLEDSGVEESDSTDEQTETVSAPVISFGGTTSTTNGSIAATGFSFGGAPAAAPAPAASRPRSPSRLATWAPAPARGPA